MSGRRIAKAGSFATDVLPATTSASGTFDLNNRQTGFNGTSPSYDANGNLTSNGIDTFVWNARNQLTQITEGGATTFSYAYDALGRRTSKSVAGASAPTTYLYDGSNAVQEVIGDVTNPILTGLGVDERFARNDVNGRTDLLTDALNSTIALTDSTGTITQQYSYDPYGNVTQSDTTTGFTNPYLYTGREADSTGLYYYRARYYSPTMGRFISEDPIGFNGGQNNFYAYVGESPFNYNDPYGLDKQFGMMLSGSVFALLGGGSGSVTFGITTDGTLAGSNFYTTAKVNPMVGLGLYGGVGLAPALGTTNGPLEAGISDWTPYVEGDLGAGEAAGAGFNFDFHGNFGLSGAYPAGPLKVFPGLGMGLMVGMGASKSRTWKSESFCDMYNDLNKIYQKYF